MHESDHVKPVINIEKVSFTELIDKIPVSAHIASAAEKADVVILPATGHCGYSEYYLTEYTIDLYDYLKEKDVNVEVLLDDDNYHELELHADLLTISTMIVAYAVWPLVLNLISSYLYDKIRRERRTELNIDIKIMVKDSVGEERSIHYKGPADKYNETMQSTMKRLFKKRT